MTFSLGSTGLRPLFCFFFAMLKITYCFISHKINRNYFHPTYCAYRKMYYLSKDLTLTGNIMKARIQLTDTVQDAIVKMADGNPGAAVSMVKIVQQGGAIDPDSFMGGFSAILSLDTMGIYGSSIYVLMNDICGGDVVKFLAVLRAVQLGFFSQSIVIDAASRQDRTGKSLIPIDELYTKVKERLPNFNNA